MIPYIKIFSLGIKVFTRPLINYTKDISVKQNKSFFKHKKTRQFLLKLGKKHFELEQKIESRLLHNKDEEMFFIKKINEEQALLNGIDLLAELLIYSILIGLSIYEILQQTKYNEYKKKKEKEEEKRIEEKIEQLEVDQQVLRGRLEEVRRQVEEVGQVASRIQQGGIGDSGSEKQLMQLLKQQHYLLFQAQILSHTI